MFLKRLAARLSSPFPEDSARPSADKWETEKLADSIRDTTKWLMTVMAAVGGILVAGLKLPDLARLPGTRLWLALGSMILALASVGAILARAGTVLATAWGSLPELEQEVKPSKPKANSFIRRVTRQTRYERELHQYLSKVLEQLTYGEVKVEKEVDNPVTAFLQAQQRLREELSAPDTKADNVRRSVLLKQLDRYEAAGQELLSFTNYRIVKYRFHAFRWTLFVGILIAALGVAGFAYVVYDPQRSPQARVNTPVPVLLVLEEKARARFGPGCQARELQGMAVGGELREPWVVTRTNDGCRAMRILVTPEIGVAVPQPATAPAMATESPPTRTTR